MSTNVDIFFYFTKTLQISGALIILVLSPLLSAESKDNKLKLSGQLRQAIIYADDGLSSTFHMSNEHSSSRLKLKGKFNLNEDVSIGPHMEVQFISESSRKSKIDQAEPTSPSNLFTIRKLELFFDSNKWGRVWLGYGDTASNDTSEQDLSGTSVIASSAVDELAGKLEFQSVYTTNGIGKITESLKNIDGLNREERFRYDTPNLNGLTLSTSILDGGAYDLAIRFKRRFGRIKMATALAWAKTSTINVWDNQINGSISFLHKSGINLTLAGGQLNYKLNDRFDPLSYYAKLGYQLKAFTMGKTAVSIDYGYTTDFALNQDKAETYGLFLVQKIKKVGTELFLGYRNFSLERPRINAEDIFVVVGGARVKF